MRFAPRLVAAAALLLPGLLPASPTDDKFQATAKAFLERYLAYLPVEATQLGDHRFDGQMPDFTPGARDQRVSYFRQLLKELDALDAKDLQAENRVDLKILRFNLESMIFGEVELKEWEWNPMVYNDTISTGFYLLTAREFAPAAERLKSAIGRLKGVPAVLASARASLVKPTRVHTETTTRQLAGTIGLVQSGLNDLLAGASAAQKTEFAEAQGRALKELAAFKEWLEKELLPKADRDFRIGDALFRKKLHFSLDSNLTKEQVLARAEADLQATQAAMYETALPLYRKFFPDKKDAEIKALDRRTVCRAVLDKLAEKRSTNDTILADAERGLKAITAFVRAKDIVRVPTEPLKLIVMPEFRRGVSIAYCDSPGPLEKNGETFYAISPTPSDWPPARVESFYREYNEYGLQELSIHEAMPGHYLQIAHSNAFRAPTMIRAIFSSGTMIEGWACYSEQVMAELGYGGPEVKMHQLKMRLRLIINAIIDQKIHTGTMTEKEALDLMVKEGFQEDGEAVAKWKRAILTSTQLSTYFVGVTEMLDLRELAKKKFGKDFVYRKYHDELLAHGSPAPRYLKELLGL
ncbi:MAG: DUF885 domain-containing protein [Verrucomicrobia bacterium]|nr:DUF885 domain-containing protein [Verrucomicrobiota bacterium]